MSVLRLLFVLFYKFKFYRRVSFDLIDLVGLLLYCLVGWESFKFIVILMFLLLDLRILFYKFRIILVCFYLEVISIVYIVRVMRLILKIFLLFVGNFFFVFYVLFSFI